MEHEFRTETIYKRRTVAHRISASVMALGIFVSQITPALATINNAATASGTYNAATTNSNTANVSVPVTQNPGLSVVKSLVTAPTFAGGVDPSISDVGDTITYKYVVTNSGNLTMNGVLPVENLADISFNGSAANGGSMSAFTPTTPSASLPITLAPGASQTFTGVYTMSQLDVDHAAGVTNGVSNTAKANGTTPLLVSFTGGASNTITTTIPPGPKLTVLKTKVLNDTNANGTADLGEVINYTYVVTNSGNVTMTNVFLTDVHFGTTYKSTDASPVLIPNGAITSVGPLGAGASSVAPVGGAWPILAPGASITFTWAHTVTQAEIDAG